MGPLEGIRVIDMGQYLAGPFGPMLLADLGADVIKIEPVTGDRMRFAAGPFIGCQRGKRDLALDAKAAEGREIVLRLAATADVFHHNMTQGVARRLGLDDEAVRAVKPDIIYCNTWAYGQEGPKARSGGLDPLYQAACGLEYEAGAVREGNDPLYLRFGMTDTANAFLSAIGVLVALYHKGSTGEGQYLWTSLLDGAAVFSSDVFLDAEGRPPPERDHLDRLLTGTGALYRLYNTLEGWIQIAAVKPSHWPALCATLGLGSLVDDERFATPAARRSHRKQLETVLEPTFASRTARQWQLALDAAGVPAEMSIDTRSGETALFDDENVRLGLVTEGHHELLGRLRQFGRLFSFSATPTEPGPPPPLCGSHTRELLSELGYSESDMERLRDEGVVYWPDEKGGVAYPWPV